jgi:hypothetical protein
MTTPLILTVHTCPDCDGDGRTFETITRFIAGTPYPAERYFECERCYGDGEIEAPTCPGCQGPMDDDPKWWHGDPYCPRCKLHLSEFDDDPEPPACRMLVPELEEEKAA